MATPVEILDAQYMPQIEAIQQSIRMMESAQYPAQVIHIKRNHLQRLMAKHQEKRAELQRLLASGSMVNLKAALDMIEAISDLEFRIPRAESPRSRIRTKQVIGVFKRSGIAHPNLLANTMKNSSGKVRKNIRNSARLTRKRS